MGGVNHKYFVSINIEKIYPIYLLVIMLIAAFLYLYKLDLVPYGIHIDEIAAAYDGYCLANFGVDMWQNQYPVYFINYLGGQSVLYGYLIAIFIKLIGVGYWAIRIPAAISGLILIFFGCKISREIRGKKFAVITGFLMLIAPYFIMRARFGLDCNLMLASTTVALYFIIRGIKYNKKIDYLISGLVVGISLYTYAISYVAITIFIILLLVYLYKVRNFEFSLSRILIFTIPVVILGIPLLLMIIVNSFDLDSLCFFSITIPKLVNYRGGEIGFSGILKNLKMPYTLLIGDKITYNALRWYCPLYLMSIPFVVIGFLYNTKNLYII